MLATYQGREVRLVGDVEENGQNPGDERHNDELSHGQRPECIRHGYGAEREDPTQVGCDHDPVSANPVDPDARWQSDNEKGGSRGGSEESDLEYGGVERAHGQ